MADQLDLADVPVTAEGVVEASPEASPADDRAQLLAERDALREQKARLEGELVARREAPPPPAAPIPPAPLTPEAIEAAYQASEINEGQRVRLHAELAARTETERVVREREIQAAQTGRRTKAEAGLAALVTSHPDLNDRTSPLIRRVSAELAVLADRGFDPNDPATQLTAVERAVAVPDPQEFHRTRIPTGGAPGGPGPAPPGKPDPHAKGKALFERLAPEDQQFYVDWRGSREAAIATLNHADEGRLRKAGRLVR